MSAEAERLKRRVEELEARIAAYEAKGGYLTPEQMAADAKAWIVRNPKAWRLLKLHAREHVKAQSRFSIKKELENLRESDLVQMAEGDYKVSNSYSAVLVRLLVLQHPKLRPLVQLKRSKVDSLPEFEAFRRPA